MIIDVPTRCPLCKEPVNWSSARNRYECYTKNSDGSLHFICRITIGDREKKIKHGKAVQQFIVGKYRVFLGQENQMAVSDRNTGGLVFRSKIPTGFNIHLIDSEVKDSDFIQDYEILK